MKNYVLSPSHYLSAAGLRLDSILKVACRVPVAYLKEYNQQFFTVVLNKYLKHVFNIVLKLNNHIWKKLQNYFFVEKNEAQTSGLIVAKKAPSLWKKKFLKKKFFQLICADMIFKIMSGNFFLNKWLSRHLSFSDFKVPKNYSSQ